MIFVHVYIMTVVQEEGLFRDTEHVQTCSLRMYVSCLSGLNGFCLGANREHQHSLQAGTEQDFWKDMDIGGVSQVHTNTLCLWTLSMQCFVFVLPGGTTAHKC